MSYDAFLALVRDRGGYASRQEAEQVLVAALDVLASRLSPGAAQALADGLPAVVTEALERRSEQEGEAEPFGAEEFCRRMAERTGASPKAARWDAQAALAFLADDLPPERIARILNELPCDYRALLGDPWLS
ncbi:DUF2267 domain-containing protein [Streptomyces sp. NPDC002994]|uniref:DUF2267 domain-containing protein n=1 Tax=Streptomyces sp. NPDC002994 TaxID=3154441 RepID=UPI0033B63CCE